MAIFLYIRVQVFQFSTTADEIVTNLFHEIFKKLWNRMESQSAVHIRQFIAFGFALLWGNAISILHLEFIPTSKFLENQMSLQFNAAYVLC